jgi:flagellar basal-body rod modification protein FlgD
MTNSPITSHAAGAAADSSSPSSLPQDPLANKEVFLSLLVAQIKNQDPMNPTDSVQFLTQLSQFTQTEQTLGIREDLKQIIAGIDKLAPKST